MNEIDKLLEYVTNNTDDIVEKIDDPEMEAIMNVLSDLMQEGLVESFIEDGIVKYKLTEEVEFDGEKEIEELLAGLDVFEDDEEGYYTSDED